MARLWTDLVDPETLTGFARRALSDYEAAKGTLARWLPNREVADISVRMVVGAAGLVEEARYRAFDAEPEFGKQPTGKRVTIDLVPLSQQGLISERDQLRLRNSSDDAIREKILYDATRNAVRAVADRSERQRGQVLTTGIATIAQDNYADTADFGRRVDFTFTTGTLWATAGADRLAALTAATDLYLDENGEKPGAMVMSSRVLRSLQAGTQFSVQLVGGGSRPASVDDVKAIISGNGLPDIFVYDRKTSAGLVVPNDTILFLPEPVDPNTGESDLGATFWGQTLAASEPEYAIQESEQPGVVAAAFTHEGIPPIKHTFVDSLTLPVLGNANRSMAMKVL